MSSYPFSSGPCRVALLGCGTVGSAVARRLLAAEARGESAVRLTHVFDRRAAEKRHRFDAARVRWTTSIDAVLRSDADIIVELIGGTEPAGAWIREALLAGKSVVTANKQVIARCGATLLPLAARQGRQLRFEAAVGGAMPIVRAIGEGLAGDRVTCIQAILNGTTNAVLTQMEETGCSLDEALSSARAVGFAEADASADIDGDDARAKLAILCALAFGLRVDPDAIPAESASSIAPADLARARSRGEAIRQLAYARFDREAARLTAWVAPVAVAATSIFGRTRGPQNAAIITGEHSGEIGIFGAGAGGDATAVAVLSDVAAIARDRAAIVPPPVLRANFAIDPCIAARGSRSDPFFRVEVP